MAVGLRFVAHSYEWDESSESVVASENVYQTALGRLFPYLDSLSELDLPSLQTIGFLTLVQDGILEPHHLISWDRLFTLAFRNFPFTLEKSLWT